MKKHSSKLPFSFQTENSSSLEYSQFQSLSDPSSTTQEKLDIYNSALFPRLNLSIYSSSSSKTITRKEIINSRMNAYKRKKFYKKTYQILYVIFLLSASLSSGTIPNPYTPSLFPRRTAKQTFSP